MPVQTDQNMKLPKRLPVFPLRDTVVFPAVPAQLSSTRPETIQLVTQALEAQSPIALFTLRTPTDTPTTEDFHSTGTAAVVQRMWHLPDGSIRFLVHSLSRIAISRITQSSDIIYVSPKVISSRAKKSQEQQALVSGVSAQFQQILALTPHLPDELQIAILNIQTPDHLSDFIAFHLNISLSEKQTLLDEYNATVRLQNLAHLMSQELEMLELGVRVRSQVQSELDHSRKEHLIREQIKALQHELGESDTRSVEIASFKKRLEQNSLPPEAHAEAVREIDRLSRMTTTAPEYTSSHTYLDWLLDLPWSKTTSKPIDLVHAQSVLDDHHEGLTHIKERILEDLAVRKLTDKNHSTILCLVGPPGVGKTSLGQSIAHALDRPFVRVALGGLRDEAELRGHRRTYVGALPGRIVQALRSAGVKDPVIMLDEMDKLGIQGSGDPASVLLEILDPAQNQAFIDHYLNLPIDLSQVLFITTANVMQNIPLALRDRLEVLTLSGYLDTEKAAIVRNHILPRQRAAHGLKANHLKVPAKTVRHIIAQYTQEPGLRQLERQIGVICRRIARRVATGKKVSVTLQPTELADYLGLPHTTTQTPSAPTISGIVTGLAATPVGGQHFTVETTTMPGTGAITLTGHLGEIIKESAQTAVSYIRANHQALSIDPRTLENVDTHIHVPAGAIPKDGPSAGLAMALSLISHLKDEIVSPEVAITGEITLTGQVLGVGAIRDKLLAAQRVHIRRLILPHSNRQEVDLLPNAVTRHVQLHYVNTVSEAYTLIFKGNAKRGH